MTPEATLATKVIATAKSSIGASDRNSIQYGFSMPSAMRELNMSMSVAAMSIPATPPINARMVASTMS